jgi:prepilin-type N-terminal cleavage/methylation domain-containing protein
MNRQHGFTLIEISIGLLIIGLLTVGLVATLTQQAELRRLSETRSLLAQSRAALLAFVEANGRLPCPALPDSNGQEAFTVSGSANVCAQTSGLLPAVTLGLPGLDPGGLLTDGWRDRGNPAPALPRALRYAVPEVTVDVGGLPIAATLTSPALGAPAPSPYNDKVRTLVQREIDQNRRGLFVCASSASVAAAGLRCGTPANTLALNAVAVVWSLGANGAQPSLYSADERQNAVPEPLNLWIDRPMAPEGAADGMFDDLLTWIALPLVMERLTRLGYVP